MKETKVAAVHPFTEGVRVTDIRWKVPELLGTVKESGEQVSRVRWDDTTASRLRFHANEFVSNEYLKEVK